jgi:peptidoglycan hydrolase-like protein with peptidoglycan-binding domain
MPYPHTRPACRRTGARTARLGACVAGVTAALLGPSASAQADLMARVPSWPIHQASKRRDHARSRHHHAAPAAPREPLALGSRGRAVVAVQRALHLRVVSGRYGSATRRAVLSFQRSHRLWVDGIVGPQTWDALFHIKPPAAGSDPSLAGSQSVSSTGGYAIPAAIVMCESGGNWAAVNPSSGAGGAYQILPSTWAAYGGPGLPQDASPAQQSRIAAEIWATQGPSAWSC